MKVSSEYVHFFEENTIKEFQGELHSSCSTFLEENEKTKALSVSTMTVNLSLHAEMSESTKPVYIKIENLFDVEIIGDEEDKQKRYIIKKKAATILEKHLISIHYKPDSKKTKNKKANAQDSFYNQATLEFKVFDKETHQEDHPDSNSECQPSNISSKIFPNGQVHIAGCRTRRTINIAIVSIYSLLKALHKKFDILTVKEDEICSPILTDPTVFNVSISMINSNFSFGFDIKQETLKNILNNEYDLKSPNGKISLATFDPSNYPGINAKYRINGLPMTTKKKDGQTVTLLIFRSGNVIITGGKNIHDIIKAYNYIRKIVSDNLGTVTYLEKKNFNTL